MKDLTQRLANALYTQEESPADERQKEDTVARKMRLEVKVKGLMYCVASLEGQVEKKDDSCEPQREVKDV